MRWRRFRNGLVLLAVVVATAVPARLSAVAPRLAQADVDVEGFVGLAVFGSGGAITHTCSGVLLSPFVFLTAGHCTDGADVALVWFGPVVAFGPAQGETGVPMTHPEFTGFVGPNQGVDVGIVLLEQAVDIATYAELPALGSLSTLLDNRREPPMAFTIVGYGLQAVASFMQDDQTRYRGTSFQLDFGPVAFDDETVQVMGSGRRRSGRGACLGDIDGPALLSGSNIVVGLGAFSTGADCYGVGAYSRLDTPRVQEFIRSVMQ